MIIFNFKLPDNLKKVLRISKGYSPRFVSCFLDQGTAKIDDGISSKTIEKKVLDAIQNHPLFIFEVLFGAGRRISHPINCQNNWGECRTYDLIFDLKYQNMYLCPLVQSRMLLQINNQRKPMDLVLFNPIDWIVSDEEIEDFILEMDQQISVEFLNRFSFLLPQEAASLLGVLNRQRNSKGKDISQEVINCLSYILNQSSAQ